MLKRFATAVIAILVTAAAAQVAYPPEEARVNNLPYIAAQSKDSSDVLAASVATVLHNPNLCCDRDSSLQDTIQRADPRSLKDISTRLGGRQLLNDGRPVMIRAELWPAASTNTTQIITALRENHPLLMEWNSQIYIVYGALFNPVVQTDPDGVQQQSYTIQKLLLLDLRYSGARRETAFNRETDKIEDSQGFLLLDWKLL